MSDQDLSITPELASVFDKLSYDENAERRVDFFSCAFRWSDESPDIISAGEIGADALRLLTLLISHRSSFIHGECDPETDPTWAEMKASFPNWPGFRAERCSQRLAKDLSRVEAALTAKWEQLDKVCKRAERIEEIRAKRKSQSADEH